jgi:hypothetical protein
MDGKAAASAMASFSNLRLDPWRPSIVAHCVQQRMLLTSSGLAPADGLRFEINFEVIMTEHVIAFLR